MPDLLQQGAAWLTDQRHAHMSHAVTYQHGASVIALNATVGRTEWDQSDEHGLIQRTESRDFLVRTADLIIGGAQTLPKAGDHIRESDGGVTFTYEVMAPGNEPPWRYSDPYRRTLRIHTKFVGTESQP